MTLRVARSDMARLFDTIQFEPNSGCWLWDGYVLRSGYGQLSVRNIRQMAHRFAWETIRGPIPPDMVMDHRHCRLKCCVNPDHLVVCTQAENLSQPDGGLLARRRLQRAQAQCKHGHEFTVENTIWLRHGRACRLCKNARMATYRRQRIEQRGPLAPKPRRRRTHCKQGHEWTAENTYWTKEGHRMCRACGRACALANWRRKRDER